jgi:predicted dienelactone hydrolase
MGEAGGMITRRELLVGGALGTAALALPSFAWAEATVAVEIVDLAVGQRRTKMAVWRPAKPRGVALFSHGHGSWPERYDQLARALVADGFVVLAPTHVDSMHHPDRASFTLQQSFPERLADMGAARGHATARFAGLPVVAVGHSFGTLTALCLGGALAGMGPFRDPAVKAVLGFSTPGKIPGLIGPAAYATVQVPMMIVTGTADVVPGFVTDPADHLFPAETVPSASYALVVQGADHGLVAGDAFARAATPARLFVEGYGLNDGVALNRLAAYKAAGSDRFTARKGKA